MNATTAGLVALGVVPLTAGGFRLVELAGGPAVIAADPRFVGFPGALVLHILGAMVFALLGAFQFLPRLRRRRPAWHKRAGRAVTGAGLVVACSALWLTVAYDPEPGTGPLLVAMRLVFAPAMGVCLVLGIRAARTRDLGRHRAWMIRAYAIGMAAGTQVFTQGAVGGLLGTGVLRGDLARTAGWLINLTVAEWAIRGRRRPRLPFAAWSGSSSVTSPAPSSGSAT